MIVLMGGVITLNKAIYIVLGVILILVTFSAGYFVSGKLNLKQNSQGLVYDSNAIIYQSFTGKVLSKTDKTLTLDVSGKKIVVEMGDKVSIMKPTPANQISANLKATSSAIPNPNENQKSDFSEVPVGVQVSIMKEYTQTGIFLVKSVFIVPEAK